LNFIIVILLAAVQGLTEFLPVSSSGHLAFLSILFGLKPSIFFATVLHMGTLVAVIIAFWDDIKNLIKGVIEMKSESIKYLGYILFTTLITGILGIAGRKIFESSYESILMISIFWFVTAIVLYILDKVNIRKKEISLWIAFLIGLAQAFAIFPGISRSGITLAVALLVGLRKKEALKYVFLISIPAITGATVLKVKDLNPQNMIPPVYIITGFLVSALIGYLAIVLLIKLVKQKKLKVFSYYLIPLSLIGLLIYYG